MPQVLTTRHDRVALITLNDPDRRNALNLAMCDELSSTIDELEADESVGALVVTGTPPGFCAGADLSQLGDSRREGLLAIYEGFTRIARSPLPSVAAVNGAAVGAGMNLALACDLRLAGAAARFDTRFLDLGIHPGGGHTWMMRNIAGQQTTMATVLFGQRLDGAASVEAGLCWSCVPDDELVDHAVAVATRAADAPRELAQRVRATIHDGRNIATHDEAIERELVDQLWSMDQPEFAERLAALKARINVSPTR